VVVEEVPLALRVLVVVQVPELLGRELLVGGDLAGRRFLVIHVLGLPVLLRGDVVVVHQLPALTQAFWAAELLRTEISDFRDPLHQLPGSALHLRVLLLLCFLEEEELLERAEAVQVLHQVAHELEVAGGASSLLLCAIDLVLSKIFIGAEVAAPEAAEDALELEALEVLHLHKEAVLLEALFPPALEAVRAPPDLPLHQAVQAEN